MLLQSGTLGYDSLMTTLEFNVGCQLLACAYMCPCGCAAVRLCAADCAPLISPCAAHWVFNAHQPGGSDNLEHRQQLIRLPPRLFHGVLWRVGALSRVP
jgi:hypothetical protein